MHDPGARCVVVDAERRLTGLVAVGSTWLAYGLCDGGGMRDGREGGWLYPLVQYETIERHGHMTLQRSLGNGIGLGVDCHENW